MEIIVLTIVLFVFHMVVFAASCRRLLDPHVELPDGIRIAGALIALGMPILGPLLVLSHFASYLRKREFDFAIKERRETGESNAVRRLEAELAESNQRLAALRFEVEQLNKTLT